MSSILEDVPPLDTAYRVLVLPVVPADMRDDLWGSYLQRLLSCNWQLVIDLNSDSVQKGGLFRRACDIGIFDSNNSSPILPSEVPAREIDVQQLLKQTESSRKCLWFKAAGCLSANLPESRTAPKNNKSLVRLIRGLLVSDVQLGQARILFLCALRVCNYDDLTTKMLADIKDEVDDVKNRQVSIVAVCEPTAVPPQGLFQPTILSQLFAQLCEVRQCLTG